jgi:hypothetical protein
VQKNGRATGGSLRGSQSAAIITGSAAKSPPSFVVGWVVESVCQVTFLSARGCFGGLFGPVMPD